MPTLQIEHAILDVSAWKKAFDSDPVRRQQSAVRRYQVLRPVDDPHYFIVDLDFDDGAKAESFRVTLHELWHRAEGAGLIKGPRARIVDTVESKER